MRSLRLIVGLLVSVAAAGCQGGQLERISEKEFVHQVLPHQGFVWVGTDDGVLRYDKRGSSDSKERMLAGAPVRALAKGPGGVWLGTDQGLFRAVGNFKPVLMDVIPRVPITRILPVDTVVWVGTKRGLFRVETLQPVTEPVLRDYIFDLRWIAGDLWVASTRNAYQLDKTGNVVREIFKIGPRGGKPISEIEQALGHTWLVGLNENTGSYGDCYLLRGGTPREVLQGFRVVSVDATEHPVLGLLGLGKAAWFSTTSGVGRLQEIPAELQTLEANLETAPIGETGDDPVNMVGIAGDRIFAGSTEGLYRKARSWSFKELSFSRVAGSSSRNVNDMVVANGAAWFWGPDGVFRLQLILWQAWAPVFATVLAIALAGLYITKKTRRRWVKVLRVLAFFCYLVVLGVALLWIIRAFDPEPSVNLAIVLATGLACFIGLLSLLSGKPRGDFPPAASAAVTPAPASGSPRPPNVERTRVFISYSHKDRRWRKRLETMLQPVVTQGVDLWSDNRIKPGKQWRPELEEALQATKVAVLLVSPHYLASEFIQNEELPRLLEAAESEDVRLLWIYLTACLYDATPIARFQAAHSTEAPLDGLSEPDLQQMLRQISKEIEKAAKDEL